tara:strand:- start:17955 stop:18722 length:768 start_codon:yes stop_codon:yes gene_type:complete
MAINVNTVYTTVLNILNKEQRGYLTPYEFNSLATQVQLEVFEKFFEDYNQYLRGPKTDEEYASRLEHIRDEFQVFEEYKPASAHSSPNVYTLPTNPAVHRLGTVFYTGVKHAPMIELVTQRDYKRQTMSPLTAPSSTFPIALYEQNKVTVYPPKEIYTGALANSDVHFSYIRKPNDVVWAYGVDQTTGAYVWDGSPGFSLSPIIGGASVNFEIDESQQTEVIIGILKYAGVVIRDPQVIGIANQIEQQEEVNSKR